MEYNDNTVQNELVELCKIMLDKLYELKCQGLISEMEYIKHTSLKKQFLKDFSENEVSITDRATI